MAENDTITVAQAAERLFVTTQHVRYLIKAGSLSAVRTTPRKTRVYASSVENLINENNGN